MEGRSGLPSNSDNQVPDQFSCYTVCAPDQDASKPAPSLPQKPGFTRLWKGDKSKRKTSDTYWYNIFGKFVVRE